MLKVTDASGKVLEQFNPTAKRVQVISPELGYVMTDLLRGPVKLYLGDLGNRPVAGKSGTTEAYTGSIFIGYTPGLAVAASLMHIDAGPKCKSGYAYLATNFPPSGWQCPTGVLFGENVGISVWKPFLEEYYAKHPWPAFWKVPAGVVTRRCAPTTGATSRRVATTRSSSQGVGEPQLSVRGQPAARGSRRTWRRRPAPRRGRACAPAPSPSPAITP